MSGCTASGGGDSPAAVRRIDCLQYANWSEEVFLQMRAGGVHAVHATIAYHGDFREAVQSIEEWNRHFEQFSQLIFMGRCGDDVRRASREGRTAVFFGFQNPSPVGDDLNLIEICHQLGVRFMQLSYNNQSLLACGFDEREDSGITRFGRQAIAEMNRVGLVVDMSHSAERSTLEAIELSSRPIAVTHANPSGWHPSPRNKSDAVLNALFQSGGMLGFSLYPNHLKGGAQCTLDDFCRMVGRTAEKYGIAHLGIGSDLCQQRPDSAVAWMRNGRWRKPDASAAALRFPPPLAWFRDNRDFDDIAAGLRRCGFDEAEVAAIMGENWLRFFDQSFDAAPHAANIAENPST